MYDSPLKSYIKIRSTAFGEACHLAVFFILLRNFKPDYMRLYFTTLLMLLATAHSFSQETKTITVKSGGKYNKIKDVYSVLKDNKTVKHGLYQHFRDDRLHFSGYYKMDKKDSTWINYTHNGKVLTKRSYTENVKTGIWEFYDKEGAPLWQYNFTTHTHNKPATDTLIYYSYQAADGSWVHAKPDVEPLWLSSRLEWTTYLDRTLRYPQDAIDKDQQGIVLVDITIDENGNAIDYAIAKSAYPALDEEGLRVMRLHEFEFIPAEKDGKKVKVKIRLPAIFRMEVE
jgi:periplasmic protein TonB